MSIKQEETKEEKQEGAEFAIAEMKGVILYALWHSLDEKEQDQALTAFWECDEASTRETRNSLVKCLAQELHYRTVFIERASVVKKIGYLKRAISRNKLLDFVDDLIRAWLVEHRRPLLTTFLDGASIPNDNGFATEDDHPTAEQFEAGIAAIRNAFNSRDVTLYICYLAFFGGASGFWHALYKAESFRGIVDKLLSDDSGISGEEVEEDGDEDLEPEATTQGFTRLDDWLIRLSVATAFQEENAPDEDTLEDIIEETVELNAGRHKSLFHRGFFHALFDRDFVFSFPGENTERRQWYVCGIVFGLLRRKEAGRCVTILTRDQREVAQELARSKKTPCGAKLLPLLVGPLLDSGSYTYLLDFARNQFDKLATDRQRADLTSAMFTEASSLLRTGRYAEGERIIDLLMKFTTAGEELLPQGYADSLHLNCQRRKAQCQQAKGSFSKASELLTNVTSSDSGKVPPNAFADHGLIEGGFRTLPAILPKPTKQKNQALVEALRRGGDQYARAIERFDGDATNAHLCMGILKTLDDPARSSPQERADHLHHALGGMRDQPDAYGVGDVKSWTEFLLMLALLETAEPSNYQPAEDILPAAIKSSVRFPIYLWERLFEAAGMFDDTGIAISTAKHLLEHRCEASDCLLENATVLARNEDLLTAVLIAFLERKNPVRLVWKQLTRLLPTCLSAEAFEATEVILDQMEKLARSNAEFRPALIEILRDSDQYSPAWETSDAEELLVDLLELEGKPEDAAEILRNHFYLLKNGGQSYELYGARQVLQRLRDLGKAGEFAEELGSLLPEQVDPSETDRTLRGRVLYIGGNETQQRYIEGLQDEFEQGHPELDVSFYLPGWTSNWNVHLAKLKPMIDEADVVVINSLIRTQLGRHLRAHCGAEHPWLPCTGRGFDSLKRSIIGAAAWVGGERDWHTDR